MKIFKAFSYSLLLTLLVFTFSSYYALYSAWAHPCKRTLQYSLGELDPRFSLTKAEAIASIQQAEIVWENALKRDLFEFNPDAEFTVNFLFDDRQQKTLQEIELRKQIIVDKDTFAQYSKEFDALTKDYEEKMKMYEEELVAYEERVNIYQDNIAYWNMYEGAPTPEYKNLKKEKEVLAKLHNKLEKQKTEINTIVRKSNGMVEKINGSVQGISASVQTYNDLFQQKKAFNQGEYQKGRINIYQFRNQSDLTLVLAHELGHALHIDTHAQTDPTSIMYYLMDKQDLSKVKPTQEDKKLVNTACKFK